MYPNEELNILNKVKTLHMVQEYIKGKRKEDEIVCKFTGN